MSRGAFTAIFTAEEEAWIASQPDPVAARTALNSRHWRLERQAQEAADVERLVAEANERGTPTTPDAVRRALAEGRVAKSRDSERRQLAAARLVVGSATVGEGRTVDDVRRWGEALRGDDGVGPSQERVAEKMGVTPRWVSELCRADGGYRVVVPNRK